MEARCGRSITLLVRSYDESIIVRGYFSRIIKRYYVSKWEGDFEKAGIR